MKPIDFGEANTTFHPAAGNEGQVEPMRAFIGTIPGNHQAVVSCHELSSEELLRVIETKKVWLCTLGAGRQPVLLSADNPIKEGWVK